MARWVRRIPCLLLVACDLVACDAERPREFAPLKLRASHEVSIVEPLELSSIEAGRVDSLGSPLRIACKTCHSLRDAVEMPQGADELTEFHRGLVFAHGDNRCGSCHVVAAREAPRLRLADGQTIPMTEAMRLCAQCHGPQHRDYVAGAHGGMSGAWDLSRGPRTRNHCINCHDPHTPKVPQVTPARRMRDRMPVPKESTHP